MLLGLLEVAPWILELGYRGIMLVALELYIAAVPKAPPVADPGLLPKSVQLTQRKKSSVREVILFTPNYKASF